MTVRDIVNSAVPQGAHKVGTIRSVLEEFFDANRELPGSSGVHVSTNVAEFEQSLISLYGCAFERGDWLGAEFSPTGQLLLTSGIFSSDSRVSSNLWIVFHDAKRRVLGATKLKVDPLGGTLIDETQLDPVLGRGKGIMTNYFRAVVPILVALKLPFSTEFVLSPESRVLRDTLIGELDMKATGIRPGCYASQHTIHPRTALVAHGPGPRVELAMSHAMRHAGSVFQPLLDVIGRGHQPGLDLPGVPETCTAYEEAVVRMTDHELAAAFARKGFACVSFDPFADTFTMARFPSDAALHERLSFVANERAPVASALVGYVAGVAAAHRRHGVHGTDRSETSSA